jgi:hypothetical protein
VRHILIAWVLLLLTVATVRADQCRYVNRLGDEVTDDGLSLTIHWSAQDTGRPTDDTEVCPTIGTGTGIVQRTALCPKAGDQLYSFAGATTKSTTPDIMAFYGLVWLRRCK